MTKSSNGFDSFSVAEQLIYGSPISIVPENKIQIVIGALCSLRNEAFTVNPSKERINKIGSLISELQSCIKIPNEKKSKIINKSSSRISQTKQKTTQVTQEEIDYLNEMIDNALEGDDIIPENENQRKLIITMLNSRKDDEIQASNYYKVEKIDEIIKDLQPVRIINNDFLRNRLEQLTKRLDLIHKRYKELADDRKETINNLNDEQNEKYKQLSNSQKQEMIDFCQTLPQFDDPRNIRFSSKYLTMRENEKNFARGGDYDGATKMHREADTLEEKERHDAVNRVVRSCNLKRSQEEKNQKRERQCFIERWNQRLDDKNAEFDRKKAVLELQETSIQSQIASIKKKLGLESSNSGANKTRSTKY